jgi:4-hydroxy-tetrahydrodipicolinate synthase
MFTGCGTALVTPFRKDQSLDEPALRRLVRRQIDAGINFLVPPDWYVRPTPTAQIRSR